LITQGTCLKLWLLTNLPLLRLAVVTKAFEVFRIRHRATRKTLKVCKLD
jgi:hypothetical protein